MLQSQRSVWAYGRNLLVNYQQKFSTEDTNELLCTLARFHLDQLTPEGWISAGVTIADCIGSGDLSSLCLYDPDVLDLPAADQYHLRQCLAYFSKRADIDIGVDRQAAALRKFRGAEEACKLTNECFLAWGQGRFQFRPDVERVLHAAQRKISELLDAVPSYSAIRARFGPGATTQVPKRMACPLVKVKRLPSCSANLSHIADALLATLPFGDGEEAYEADVEIHSARIAFVPKTAKTDRAICTEPTLNSMFQLGIGEILADCLKRVGIDIRDQSANQRAALYGSISGETATLDLSSASDTVALRLVDHLFPEEWSSLFRTFRSAEADVDGEIVQLQKISSMGNGFTFPLETIIFWALAQSCSEIYARGAYRRVLVYGDDIIVPTAAAVPLMEVLVDLGFTPNPSKSFWTGSFRESCGQDYVNGIDVRPLFVSGPLTGADIFRIRNYYYRKGFHLLWKMVESWIHPSIRTRGPEGYGDGHLIDRAYVARRSGDRKGWDGYTFETWAYSAQSLKNELVDRLGTWKKSTRLYSSSNGSLRKEGFRYFEYKQSQWFRVRRLATYCAYLAEDRHPLLRKEGNDHLVGPVLHRTEREYWEPDRDGLVDCAVKRDDRAHFTIPGRASAVRMKIYTFEPPRLN